MQDKLLIQEFNKLHSRFDYLDQKIDITKEELQTQINEIDSKLIAHDKRFDQLEIKIDEKFLVVDKRLENIEADIVDIKTILKSQSHRTDLLDTRLTGLEYNRKLKKSELQ